MFGWVIGAVILGFAAFIVGRSVYNIFKGRGGCAGCGKTDCPHCRTGGGKA